MYAYMCAKANEQEAPSNMAMLKHAKERLLNRPAKAIAEAAGLEFDEAGGFFCFQSLGQDIRVSYPELNTTFAGQDKQPATIWNLIMLHHLDMADGSLPGPELIAFRELQAGVARGVGFDQDSAKHMAEIFAPATGAEVKAVWAALGGVFVPGNADICAEFFLMPRYPLTLKLWLADEEFPCEGKLLLNKNAARLLSDEDAVMAGVTLLKFLECQYHLMFPH